ncbi:uncharacterized protein LOC132915369 [Bombus pascuorum]|uniref:uncharacterized protein LOC132915369 n=1 Tax=Bombus pascuorum TaxID=65598 RepID=UPI00298E4061|nr:uncharacterized protein LOC132915369 [Bombus pascuorum]
MVISVPDDAGKVKATQLASHLSKVLDSTAVKVSTPTTMAELKIVGIDISMEREEIQQELAKAAGCEATEVKVWETGTSRTGMGSAFVKCPVAGARKLALAGRVALGWSMAKVIALPKRPLQCFRCGESGHRVRGCMAPTPRCPICESRGALADHRMGSEACKPPKVIKKGIRWTILRKTLTGDKGMGDTVGSVTEAMAQAWIASVTEETLGGTRIAGLEEHRTCSTRPSGRAVVLAVVAEPYCIPKASNWIGDASGLIAITWPCTAGISGSLVGRGPGFVAVQWMDIVVVGVYISPNCGIRAFGDFLDEMGECIRRCLPHQVLVLGDFNAHSTQWGNDRTTASGRELTNWAAGLGLLLVNQGSVSTCVGWREASVIDLTWATPRLHARIHGWRVAVEMETLSDHLYVLMEIQPNSVKGSDCTGRKPPGRLGPPPLRWKLKERDKDMLRAAATVAAWCWNAKRNKEQGDVDMEASELHKFMVEVCDASMPRSSTGGRRDNTGGRRDNTGGRRDNTGVYWWSQEIADLRDECCRSRRLYTRAQRRRW